MPNIYESITDKIVASIEAGAGQWRMPWHTRAGEASAVQPVSLSTGKRYRGMNTVLLWCAQQERGYDSALWGTFNAWKDKDASVRKGEKASQVVFWKSNPVRVTDPVSGETATENHLIARGYWVFNVAQVDGYQPKLKPADMIPGAEPGERIARAETFFDRLGFDVRHGGNQAFCARSSHHIQLPHFNQFFTPADYYSTRGHESVHRSGHDDMLNREFGKRFGDLAYAAEELVAELGAAFLCGHLGISNEPRPDHAQYLTSWLRVLKSDKRAIFTAASKAQAACDCLVALGDATSVTSDEDEPEAIQLAA